MKFLYITEIFRSIQGESSFAGLPCTFIRLSGCPLRCRWCDTVYSFKAGKQWSIPDVLAQVKDLGVPLVEITGGEPLAQEACLELMTSLVAAGYQVLIETSGALSIAEIPPAVTIIMDLKCPASGMAEKNHWPNLNELKPQDEIKFVIAAHSDFEWAVDVIHRHHLQERFAVLLSPAWGLVQPKQLASWMLDAKLRCRLNLQQHKYIWGPREKGV